MEAMFGVRKHAPCSLCEILITLSNLNHFVNLKMILTDHDIHKWFSTTVWLKKEEEEWKS